MFVCFVYDSLCDVVCGVFVCVFVIVRAPLFNVFARRCPLIVVVCLNVILYVVRDVLCGVVRFGFC